MFSSDHTTTTSVPLCLGPPVSPGRSCSRPSIMSHPTLTPVPPTITCKTTQHTLLRHPAHPPYHPAHRPRSLNPTSTKSQPSLQNHPLHPPSSTTQPTLQDHPPLTLRYHTVHSPSLRKFSILFILLAPPSQCPRPSSISPRAPPSPPPSAPPITPSVGDLPSSTYMIFHEP